ncbi:MAG TPA: AAA family ATPase [Polyangium sp.]|nr:AAA family ATPase [Polyangium sp.]
MKIASATCDFATIRREKSFYVDKTMYLPKLEGLSGKFQIFLRPRRFGKSTLLSMLEKYYDIALANRFDGLFGGLWIHENPTPEKNQYLVLHLDFSPVASEGTEAEIRRSFASQVNARLGIFIHRYATVVPELVSLVPLIDSNPEDIATTMTNLSSVVERANRQVYLFIDEYDHFGNRLISDGLLDVYQTIVRSAGFLRSFYAALEAFTSSGTLARMFVTGVSPIMLDDLSSGFNIITHISQQSEFNGLAGFTAADVERGVDILDKHRRRSRTAYKRIHAFEQSRFAVRRDNRAFSALG